MARPAWVSGDHDAEVDSGADDFREHYFSDLPTPRFYLPCACAHLRDRARVHEPARPRPLAVGPRSRTLGIEAPDLEAIRAEALRYARGGWRVIDAEAL